MEQDNRTTYEYKDERTLNGTYYQRPGQTPDAPGAPAGRTPAVPANAFARASLTIGGIALVSVFTFTVFPAVILGSLALILALLSRGSELTFHKTAKNGILVSVMAMVINIVLVGGTVALIFGDNSFHDELNATYEEMYGMTYDELLEGIMNGNVEAEDVYEQLFEEFR